MPDSSASQYQRARTSVRAISRIAAPAQVFRRYRLAIGRWLREQRAAGGRMGKCRKWTEEELALLGTMPDTEIARRTKRTTIAVVGKRGELRIREAKARKSKCDRHSAKDFFPDAIALSAWRSLQCLAQETESSREGYQPP